MDVALVVAVLAVLVALAVYTRLDLRDFTRFRTLTETRARQRTFRRWLLTSLGLFGASTVVLLLLIPRSAVTEVRVAARTGPALDSLVAELESDPSSFHATLVGLVGAFFVGGAVSLLALRKKPELLTTPVAALIPRTRGELPWGAALSVNAGVVEELLFRLALPAALYALLVPAGLSPTTAGLVAFGGSAVLFGAMPTTKGSAARSSPWSWACSSPRCTCSPRASCW